VLPGICIVGFYDQAVVISIKLLDFVQIIPFFDYLRFLLVSREGLSLKIEMDLLVMHLCHMLSMCDCASCLLPCKLVIDLKFYSFFKCELMSVACIYSMTVA